MYRVGRHRLESLNFVAANVLSTSTATKFGEGPRYYVVATSLRANNAVAAATTAAR
jgi:hypothetical protein